MFRSSSAEHLLNIMFSCCQSDAFWTLDAVVQHKNKVKFKLCRKFKVVQQASGNMPSSQAWTQNCSFLSNHQHFLGGKTNKKKTIETIFVVQKQWTAKLIFLITLQKAGALHGEPELSDLSRSKQLAAKGKAG